MKKNLVKDLWREGKAAIGVWLTLGSPIIGEIIASLGYDFVVIDTEHAAIGIETTQSIIQGISGTSTVPIVRVAWNEPALIQRVLDAGAYGIIIPMVNSREEAIRAVKSCRYPPEGIRSYGGPRVKLYGGIDYYRHANQEIAIIVQIEHIDAVNKIDEILSVDGIDAFLIGPADLAVSLRLEPSLDHISSEYIAAIDKTLEVGKRFHIPAGIFVTTPEAAKAHISQGFQFVGLASDEHFLRIAATAARDKVFGDRKTASGPLF